MVRVVYRNGCSGCSGVIVSCGGLSEWGDGDGGGVVD